MVVVVVAGAHVGAVIARIAVFVGGVGVVVDGSVVVSMIVFFVGCGRGCCRSCCGVPLRLRYTFRS